MSEHNDSCLGCAYFRMTTAEPDWSDVTPGDDFAIECWKRVWEFDTYQDSEESFREKMGMAKTCEHFRDYKLGLE